MMDLNRSTLGKMKKSALIDLATRLSSDLDALAELSSRRGGAESTAETLMVNHRTLQRDYYALERRLFALVAENISLRFPGTFGE